MRMSAAKIKVLLLFPPRWDALAPYPAVPQLTAYLRLRGMAVKSCDLNARLMHWMLSERGTKELLDALKPIVRRTARFSGDEKISQFAAWAGLWLDEMPRDHRQIRKDLACPSAWTLRKTHAFQVIVHRAWEMLDILDAANRLLPGIRLPHRLYLENLLARQVRWNPDIAGFSAVTQRQLLTALDLASFLKNRGCSARLIAGGCAVSSAFGARHAASALPDALDCLVVGPGEEAVVELAGLMQRQEPWPRIVQGQDRDVQIEYAPDLYLSDKSGALGLRYSFPYPMSDGCRWRKCKFCGLYCTRRYKVSDPDSLAVKLDHLGQTLGCVSFFNTGAELAAKDAARIGRALEKKQLRIRWQSMARADGDWTKTLCRKVKSQGFEYVMFGLESLSDPALKLMGKGLSAAEQISALEAACRGGLKPAVSLIYDFPGETMRDLEATLAAIEPYVDDLSSLTLLRFHLDRTSIMAAHEEAYAIKTQNRILRSLYRDDIFQIRYRDLKRDRRHLERALHLFDRWIHALHRKRSMLFIRDPQSVQLGFDLNFFFEGCRAADEGLDEYFTREGILNRRYRLNARLIRAIEGKRPDAGYYHKYLMQGMGKQTFQAAFLRRLAGGRTVRDALADVHMTAEENLTAYLSLIQLINGLDLLGALTPDL